MVAKHQGRSGRPWARIKANWKRISWVCYLCGHQIPRGVPFNHPLAYTVDHIDARSRGGPPTMDNTAPAHRRCNSRKGTKQLHELELLKTSRAW
jgi:5-methylcytosine-specific restriction endonuclease McrA